MDWPVKKELPSSSFLQQGRKEGRYPLLSVRERVLLREWWPTHLRWSRLRLSFAIRNLINKNTFPTQWTCWLRRWYGDRERRVAGDEMLTSKSSRLARKVVQSVEAMRRDLLRPGQRKRSALVACFDDVPEGEQKVSSRCVSVTLSI